MVAIEDALFLLCSSSMNEGFWLWFSLGSVCRKKKVKGEVHVMKNLNINSKLFSREVKIQTASFPLETCWVSMWFPACVTHCCCLCYSHLALKPFPTFSGEGIHPTVLYRSILEWDESFLSVFTADLKGTYATAFSWKSPRWRQVKLRGKSFAVVF